MSNLILICMAITTAALLAAAALLHLIPRLGRSGQKLSDALCRAPALDWVILYFTGLPLIAGPIVAGWRGLIGAALGQVGALIIWTLLHELTHPNARKGPRIVTTINRNVGVIRNLTAVYWTAIVAPLFLLVRLAEVAIYPPLTWLVGLPPYRGADWVNVSRHKFSGLVGHDLVWCLYCDWMTGVWSLGSEMLRNVESFWCPIRFYSDKKCANCAVDFPDVANGWVPADGTMADVVATHKQMYPASEQTRPWFGHPVRITVKGEPVAAGVEEAEEGVGIGR